MEKIGSSNYFWSYPSAALQKKKNKIEELENVVAQLEKSNADLDVEIAEAGTIREPCELRDMALSELEQERQLQEKNEKELARYKECDPEILLAKEKVAETAKEGANRWTDNIFSIQSHCVDKFGIEKSDFNRNFRISDDFDNIP
ncbi:Meiotic nuclear division protein 1 [Umbelopsis sp. WA50703]